MSMEKETVSGWFTLNSGFKVYGRCPGCHSPRISFHKSRIQGMKGISKSSQGLIPVCMDCGKNLPTQISKEQKKVQAKMVQCRMI